MNASVHWRTPSLTVSDSRGLRVRQGEYLRSVAGEDGTVTVLISRQQHDVNGRLVAQWDPRLPAPNVSTVYGLAGQVLKVDSVDTGWRLNLPGLAGEPLERWDARGNHWHTTFDAQLRVVALEENGEAGVDLFTYADATADEQYNLRGQLLEQQDRSGTLRTDSFALGGQPLADTRTFHDGAAFTSRRSFNALGATLEQIDAGGHRQQSFHGLSGLLQQVKLLVNGEPDWQTPLLDVQYNASGQIIEQLAGNRVLSQWTYDPADGRLHTQSSRKDGSAVLQNLEYFYDSVGNITRIEDHAFQPRYFANQLINGHRDFTYDSLYRLTSATGYDDAPPPDIPGLPQPGDPNNRLNYTQTYRYDDGGNLIERCHVRAGNNSTRQMFIDLKSNRGVRWKTGDEPPDFDELFDSHGNQKSMHPGKPLTWNARDELESVTLIQRENDRSDAEHYRYSQGMRVFKRHETFAANAEHFHQVRYLPGLEIRTRDNGEELHVITLGNARCLHWAAEKPDAIANDQMRYNLEDHLGSSVMELDQDAVMISQEGYYPFGETAWMAPDSETTYRFIRYSGKEMDVSGLYYYGARYYAAWLQRWVSADPARDVDGLNLYGFVGNNPLTFVDEQGNSKEKFDIVNFSNFVTTLGDYSATTLDQMLKVSSGQYGTELLSNVVAESLIGTAGFFAGYFGGGFAGSTLTAGMPAAVGYLFEMIAMHVSGDIGEAIVSKYTSFANMTAPLIPQTSAMSVAAIDQKIGITERSSSFTPADAANTLLTRVVGSYLPGVGAALNIGSRVQEAEDIKQGLDPVKIEKIETMLSDWRQALTSRMADIEKAFRRVGQNTINSADVLSDKSRLMATKTIRLSTLREQTSAILGYIESSQTTLKWYKEDLLTDNRFLREQAKPASKFQTFVQPFTKHKFT
ncbi:toxin [Pseudomonas sp. FP2196]|uniref:RHS repeat domain-containing protein n=1 Tax=Pseudomonas sp. FP2196 TaxID=2954086 RepID=UPI002736F188|nr:RHS repeat-associated core domain-containing protein [Pseudomonas sp. FP2196]WLH34489.1 toxin [Pseudomonas sp. FP2196]